MKTRYLLLLPFMYSALAAAAEQPDMQGREALRQEVLGRIKETESYSHQERIRILQEADACVQHARSRDDFRSCEQREQQARDRHREEMRGKREAFREELRQRFQGRGQGGGA